MAYGSRRFGFWLAVVGILCLTVACGDGRRVVIAWDDPNGASAMQAFDVHPPWLASTRPLAIDAGSILRFALGKIFAVSPSAGTIKVIDPVAWRVERTFSLGATSRPIDIAVVNRRSAYVTREFGTHLLKVDLRNGKTSERIDFRPLADADGIPDLGTMAIDGNRLLVQVRRLNDDALEFFQRPAYLGVVDLRTTRLVDFDAATPGIQGIELEGTAPLNKMQIGPTPRRLFVNASWNTHNLEAGIEMIDLDRRRSMGIVAAETVPDKGICCDLAGFVMVSESRGYFTISTDSSLSSHLHFFTLEGGVDDSDLYTSTGYEARNLVHDPLTDQLFLPTLEADLPGFHVFDAATGTRLSGTMNPTPGRISDLTLICDCPGRSCAPDVVCAAGPSKPRRWRDSDRPG